MISDKKDNYDNKITDDNTDSEQAKNKNPHSSFNNYKT